MAILCPVCSHATHFIGFQNGRLDGRRFHVNGCPSCHYAFVVNYRHDYSTIYDDDYYAGQGADPSVDYLHEIRHLESTIRVYEWEGLCKIFKDFFPEGGRWLDYGCGLAGLVEYAQHRGHSIIGCEYGWAASAAKQRGPLILSEDELAEHREAFDFVTLVEVLEHVADPIDLLRRIRTLMKPGGVLFLTTGNAQPWRSNLLKWSYTRCPDVHISFYEPQTVKLCLQASGFQAQTLNYGVGMESIIKFKILKNMRWFKYRSRYLDALPWSCFCRWADMRYQVSLHPYGVAL